LALVPLAAQDAPEKVGRNDELKFDQDKAQAHMRELEERMFRLANLIRDAQPDDASRLLMGVRKAREHLIADRMQEASQLLASLRLEQAVGEQKEIIDRLEELKKLLLSADIGLELKLEQLRKLREARERLAKLIEKEQQQLDQTQAQGQLTEPNRDDLAALEQGERRNQRADEDLEQLVRSFGPSTAGAAGALSAAGQSMGSAAGKLGQSQAEAASKDQEEALKKLEEASLNLAQAEEQLRKELEALVRQQVMENLASMITQQRQVRETTEKLSPRVAEKQQQALVSVRRLAESEDVILALCEDSIDLAELTEFSLALPIALRTVGDKMAAVADRLRVAQADETLIAEQQQIEVDLAELLDALKQASRPSSNPSTGQCMGCQGNLNKLLAEVKMLRWMEQSLQLRTARVDGQELSDAQRQSDAAPLAERQREIRDITRRISETFAAPSGN
jgi:myosin heavy subunit